MSYHYHIADLLHVPADVLAGELGPEQTDLTTKQLQQVLEYYDREGVTAKKAEQYLSALAGSLRMAKSGEAHLAQQTQAWVGHRRGEALRLAMKYGIELPKGVVEAPDSEQAATTPTRTTAGRTADGDGVEATTVRLPPGITPPPTTGNCGPGQVYNVQTGNCDNATPTPTPPYVPTQPPRPLVPIGTITAPTRSYTPVTQPGGSYSANPPGPQELYLGRGSRHLHETRRGI